MEQRKILLIGKTGDGKSSAGNTILGDKVFTPTAGANSATAKPVRGHGLVQGRKITVIDTPGLFDTVCDDSKTKSEIIKALVECAPAIHAIVLVLRVGRYTRQENEVVEEFLNLMKEEHVLKHTVILFTFGEQLEGQTLKDFVKSNYKLQEFTEKCEGRCHVIDNKCWNDCHSGDKSNRVQVNNLLDTIDKMVQKNGCFTTELLQAVDKAVQEEMKINKCNLPPEVKLEKAKEIVCMKILKQFVGAATGAVIGAFLGLVATFAAGVILLQALNPAGGAAAVAGGAGGTIAIPTVVGSVGGAITGWKVAEEADSVYDAMNKAAKVNFENAKAVFEKAQQFSSHVLNKKTGY